ncbi:hypothetical protein B0T18DRAFT_238293 [Schizothecium vesticola]|uniref:Uncharacterized protein n=1 Tax=Schizothecium vesticola TaxID=314040 RepID=A0AA40BPJ1_9PEZI|nr:hypothetical protein B0T18DRAFT_238293 [Schizothecium vesticola]
MPLRRSSISVRSTLLNAGQQAASRGRPGSPGTPPTPTPLVDANHDVLQYHFPPVQVQHTPFNPALPPSPHIHTVSLIHRQHPPHVTLGNLDAPGRIRTANRPDSPAALTTPIVLCSATSTLPSYRS